ncbi:MAG: hypothetical protein IKQ31_01740 [Clostridia bacterium]|nr:hypothetical protein [Clostridia bacterium]
MKKDDLHIILQDAAPVIEKATQLDYNLTYITPQRDEKWLDTSILKTIDLMNFTIQPDDVFSSNRLISQTGFTFYFIKNNSDLQKILPDLNPVINYFLTHGTSNIEKATSPTQLRTLNAQKTYFFPNFQRTPNLNFTLDSILISDYTLSPRKTEYAHLYDYLKSQKSVFPQLSILPYTLDSTDHAAVIYQFSERETQSLFETINDKNSFIPNYKSKIDKIKSNSESFLKKISPAPSPQTK